jgi:hypothetical protein
VQYLHDYDFVPEEPHVKPVHALAVLVLLSTAVAPDAQIVAPTVTLRYHWTKGESRSYRTTTRTDSTVTGAPAPQGAPPGPVTVSQSITQVLKFTADAVTPEGAVTLRQTFQSIRMESSSPMGKVVVDSAAPAPAGDAMAQSVRKLLDAMVGESVTVDMAPDGAVRRVDGASRIAEKIATIVAADPSAGGAAQSLRGQLSDDALKSALEQTFPRLALPPVKAGDTWTGQLAMGNPVIGRITGRSIFTLNAIEGPSEAPLARIAIALTLRQDVVPLPSGPAGMVMTLGSGAKGTGELLFEASKGQIQKSTMKTDLPSSVVMTGPDGAPATVDNKTTITMTMELVDK